MSSQGYLGAFETKEAVQITVSAESVAELLTYMADEELEISKSDWNRIWKEIYESDLVSDFIEGVMEIAMNITGKGN